jgi:hypothetical protein
MLKVKIGRGDSSFSWNTEYWLVSNPTSRNLI